MLVGLAYFKESELRVAVSILGIHGEQLTEGFTSDTARNYASILNQFADELDKHIAEQKKEGS